MNGDGWRQWTIDKVNGEIINWCEVRKYKIEREKNWDEIKLI